MAERPFDPVPRRRLFVPAVVPDIPGPVEEKVAVQPDGEAYRAYVLLLVRLRELRAVEDQGGNYAKTVASDRLIQEYVAVLTHGERR